MTVKNDWVDISETGGRPVEGISAITAAHENAHAAQTNTNTTDIAILQDDVAALPVAGDIPTALVDLDTTVTGAQLNADHAKLAGVASGATAVDALTDLDTTVTGSQLNADHTKLAGVATAATANATDAALRDRTTHTGTQTSATISDFVEAAQDALATALAGTSGVSVTYNDAANTITVTGLGDASATAETIRDAIGVALVGVGVVTVTPNDALDTITISSTATVNSTDAALRDRSTHTGSQSADTLTDGTTNKAFLATERTKLTGIATAATANSSDATLLARANHTGTQQASTISDLGVGVAGSDDLTLGESTISRRLITATNVSQATGALRLTYFTAKKTETTTSVRLGTGVTAAAATPTLVRVGIYSVAANGDITLVASTPNDTALFAAASTFYTKALSVPLSKVRGQRYAVGVLVVTGTTAPTLQGQNAITNTEMGQAPRLGGLMSAQADLPASALSAAVSDNSHIAYVALVP